MDRDTCLCKISENTKLLTDALFIANVIKISNLDTLAKDSVCSVENKRWMYGECVLCRQKILFEIVKPESKTEDIKWQQWTTKKEERML